MPDSLVVLLMAWKDIVAAFEFKGPCSADALSVLRVIAYNIRDNGFAFCGVDYLTQMIGRKSRKTTHVAINELIARGYIIRESGRFEGHRNHYYLNIPGATSKPPSRKSQAVDNSVESSLQNSPEAKGVCKPRPEEVCKPRPAVCNPVPTGCVEDDPVNRIRNRQIKTDSPIREGADYTPPPSIPPGTPPLKPHPPVGSDDFRRDAIQVCYEAGASRSVAEKFFIQHASENWSILEQMPLEIAAMRFVEAWKRSDIRAWSSEALSRYREKHGI